MDAAMKKSRGKKAQAAAITAFKGFNPDWTCRGFQYEVGKTYEHNGEVVRCASGGFHSCENPLDVFGYYPPGMSRYAIVECGGTIDRDDEDTKIASATITINAEIKIPEMVERAVDWVMAKVDRKIEQVVTGNSATNTGDQSAATNTGDQSAATNTGDQSAATNTGDRSAATNTGYRSAATNTGDRSAATNTGYRSAATNTGDQSAATNTGNQSAATNTGNQSAATNTGNQSAATNTGDWSAATNTGNQSAASVEGKDSVAITTGYQSKAMACEGSAIVLCYRDEDYRLIHIRAGIAGKDVKENTWYSLDAAGEFVELKA
jgi:hypothetical protein